MTRYLPNAAGWILLADLAFMFAFVFAVLRFFS
jgi:hypothetical protein